jgi:shikimate dehydrogenase
MRALDMGGLSVTMPHKDDVAARVDRRTPEADALGAVNCVVPIDGQLVGANTDGPGFLDALASETGFDVAGRRAVVFGAGGAARAIVVALAGAGATDVAVVNRSPERAGVAAALAPGIGRAAGVDAIEGADLVVNATSVGMGDGQVPFDPAQLRPGQVVADVVYHPSPTPLVAAAGDRGVEAVGGLGMLVHQAAHAFRLWTGIEPPLPEMTAAARAALEQRR